MKILKTAVLSLALLFMTACGNKLHFKKQEPLANAALVYVYQIENVSSDESTNESYFNIRIDNKPVKQRIVAGEYMAFDLKPLNITISATKGQVEEKKLSVSLKSGKTYYFRIIDNLEGDQFSFEQVEPGTALKEISKTGLAGSMVDNPDNIITEFVNPKDDKKESPIIQQSKPSEAKAAVAAPVVAPKSATPVRYETKRVTASKLDEIKEAYKMKKEGVISDEEFQTIKSQILAK